MTDAAVLFGTGRVRRAYSLGVIAIEEAAKVQRCRQELRGWTGGITVAELNKALRPGKLAHERRYAQTLSYLWSLTPRVSLPPGFADVDAMARKDMRARERALYVEVAPSGDPMTPAGIDEDEARTWVSAMIRYFAMLGPMWRSALDDELAAAQDSMP